jgi:hypothetical protein
VSTTKHSENQDGQELKDKRNRLYKLFVKNPMYTQLALEIRALDDQLARMGSETMSQQCRTRMLDSSSSGVGQGRR